MRVGAWLLRQHQGSARTQIQILHVHFVLVKWREITIGRKGVFWRKLQLQNRVAVIHATIVHVKLSISGNDVWKTLRVNDRRPSGLLDAAVGSVRGGEKDTGHVQTGGIVPEHPTVEIALIAERAERDD